MTIREIELFDHKVYCCECPKSMTRAMVNITLKNKSVNLCIAHCADLVLELEQVFLVEYKLKELALNAS